MPVFVVIGYCSTVYSMMLTVLNPKIHNVTHNDFNRTLTLTVCSTLYITVHLYKANGICIFMYSPNVHPNSFYYNYTIMQISII